MNRNNRLRQTASVLRRWWWIATGERANMVRRLAEAEAATKRFHGFMAEYRDALFELKWEHRGASAALLRSVADRIDCGPGCERVGLMDQSTGMVECPLSDRGECPFDDASQLRDLAAALDAKAKVDGQWPALEQAQRKLDGGT